MRSAAALALALSLATPAFSGPREVNLDRPGALEALEDSNPGHYAKVLVVIRASQVESCEHVPKVLKVNEGLELAEHRCNSYLLLTSHPPKRHVTFVLDDVRYTTNVVTPIVLRRPEGKPMESLEHWFTQPLGANPQR